jgi:minor extracellular serine protease Vpr
MANKGTRGSRPQLGLVGVFKAARRNKLAACLSAMVLTPAAIADTLVNKDTQADAAFAKYGASGQGVIVAIMDRGIDYTHPDFRNADGTTRIKMMWDMSAQNLCASNNPAPIVYTEAQINAALATGGTPLAERDAVGHGTVTAGIAAGNGSALGKASLQYAGIAPQADLLIVKVTSEGAPAHGTQAAEVGFQGCFNQALDLVTEEAAALGEPIVGLINSGAQWGPIDGTSAVSGEIDLDFGSSTPGRIYTEASGDEGAYKNHARATYTETKATVFPFNLSSVSTEYFQIWYSGALPANVKITANDDGDSVTAAPNSCESSTDSSIEVCSYLPGEQFYPWQSSGPDAAVWVYLSGHGGSGSVSVRGTQSGTGTADVYGDSGGTMSYTRSLTPGRLSDYASTSSALVAGCYNVRTAWTDINDDHQTLTDQGKANALWTGSSGGPTRDGRSPPNGGVDITAPGGNLFAAYGLNSYWETFQFNLIKGGEGYYGRQSATSGASPILTGAIALMLQIDPDLTGAQARQIIHNSAITDSDTGATPNDLWGLGKLDILAALDGTAALLNTVPALNTTSLNFGTQTVGTESTRKNVVLSNTGTDALGLGGIAVDNTSYLITNKKTCGSSVAAGGKCTIVIAFKPKASGAQTGILTIKEFNPNGPLTVALTGTGD